MGSAAHSHTLILYEHHLYFLGCTRDYHSTVVLEAITFLSRQATMPMPTTSKTDDVTVVGREVFG